MKKQWIGLGLAVVLPLLPLTVMPVPALAQQAEGDRNQLSSEAEELNQQAIQLFQQGKTAAAIPLAERALEIRQQLSAGQDHPAVAQSLSNLATLYASQGRLEAAEPLYQEALAMRQRLFEGDHPDVATNLNNLASLYRVQGRLGEAEPLFLESLAMIRRLFPGDHPNVAASLNNLATLYAFQGRFEEAEPIYQESLAMRRRFFEGDHPDVAANLNNLAGLYASQGRLEEAESFYQDALAMRRRLFPDGHPDVATSLNSLAALYQDQGRSAEAEPLYQEALAVRQRLFEGDHPDVALSQNNLAVLYRKQGRLSEAEPLFQEALAMRQRLFPGDHPAVATSLNNAAELYRAQGRLGESEPLYQEALAMYRRLFEGDHPSVALSLNNVAGLYRAQGRSGEAEPLYQEALAMMRRLFPKDHPNVATSLDNLGSLYQDQGRLGEAEPLHQEALAMYRRLFPEDHPDVAASQNNLAALYESQGRLGEAASLYQEALAMHQRLFPGDHPAIAGNLDNLAGLYKSQGSPAEAEPLYQEALAMYRRLFPDKHPDLAISLNNIGAFYQAQDNYPQALDLRTQAADVEEAILAENLRIGSESQKQKFLDLFRFSTSAYISFHLQDLPDNPGASRLALTTILRRKGRVLDAMGQALETLRDNLDFDGRKLFAQFANAQTRRSALSFRPLPSDTTLREQALAERDRLDAEIRRLEGDLSARSAEFRQIAEPVTIEAVQQAIPQDAALVEFVQYRPFNAKASQRSERFGAPRYAAYVLLPDGTIRWRDLGEATPIDAGIQRFRTLLSRLQRNFDPLKATARDLDRLLMEPVREMTGDASHLLLSPDSGLNLLPFAALVDEDGQYLVQNYRITYLTSGRDLLRSRFRDRAPQAPLVLANPAYGSPGTRSQAVGDRNQGNSSNSSNNNDNRRSGRLAALEFGPLPGTKVEGEALAGIVPDLTLLTETEASENSLKGWQRPKILHLATHGFFLEPEASLNANDPSSIGSENPLLRSGLALAGFNQRQSEGEDGVLTALEVTGLNLRGTRLVVLSACETGLGDIAAGEGVYGLRRAFTLAGAESQLMSLWEVSDDGTQELMVAYYQRLQNGEGRGEALRQVQLEMLQNPDRAHPFFWAAFIPAGDWSPLE